MNLFHVQQPSSRQKRIASRVQSAVGQGQRLDKGVRHLLEPYLGSDLSQIYVHQGHEAHTIAQDCGTLALACGNHVFFQDGACHPRTASGLRLLAHEAVHALQQGQRLEERRCFPQRVQLDVTRDGEVSISKGETCTLSKIRGLL